MPHTLAAASTFMAMHSVVYVPLLKVCTVTRKQRCLWRRAECLSLNFSLQSDPGAASTVDVRIAFECNYGGEGVSDIAATNEGQSGRATGGMLS